MLFLLGWKNVGFAVECNTVFILLVAFDQAGALIQFVEDGLVFESGGIPFSYASRANRCINRKLAALGLVVQFCGYFEGEPIQFLPVGSWE